MLVMSNVHNSLNTIVWLGSPTTSDKDIKAFFHHKLNYNTIRGLSEIAYNIYYGFFPIIDNAPLLPLKKTLQLLSSLNVSFVKKRVHLGTNGLQFSRLVLPLVIPYLLDGVGKDGVNPI